MRLCFNLKSLFVNFKHSCYCTYKSLNTCCCVGILEVWNFTSLMWYFFSLRLQTQRETWFFERGSNIFKVNYAVGKLAHLSFNPLINKFIYIGVWIPPTVMKLFLLYLCLATQQLIRNLIWIILRQGTNIITTKRIREIKR